MLRIFLIYFLFASFIYSQQKITGKIIDENNKPIFGVNIYLPELDVGTTTNFEGNFSLSNVPLKEKLLLKISHIGFKNIEKYISLPLKDNLIIILENESIPYKEVVVTDNREGVYLKDSPIRIEVITEKEIQKHYGLDITRSLDFSPGIKVQDNCGVCGTTDIRIQGLEGQYSQILIDGHPIVSNLGSVYGLLGIHPFFVKQIEIVKGPGTILYGSEAVSGTINIILKKPFDLPKYTFSLSSTTHGEHDFSFSGVKLFENYATSFIGNYSGAFERMDMNKDGFTDIPVFNRISLMNQWIGNFSDDLNFSSTLRYYYEDRFGGEMNWNKIIHRGSNLVYGESIYTNRQEFFGGLKKILNQNKFWQLNFSQVYHNQNSYYGIYKYDASQYTGYIDFLYNTLLNESNSITIGSAYKFERYDDNTAATSINNEINEPSTTNIYSLFAQQEYKFNNEITSLSGIRLNYHDKQKFIFQPRLSLKYSPYENSIFRFSFGTGFRTVNIFTEDHAVLTGSRILEISESLQPEKSINSTISFVQDFDFFTSWGRLELSTHLTHFSNQIIPDYNSDINKIIYSNLDGYSISKGFEFSFDYNFIFPLNINFNYEFLETFKTENGIRSEIEFNPKHKINMKLNYDISELNSEVNISGKWVGVQKLPEFPVEFNKDKYSKSYSICDITFIKNFDFMRLQFGLKNIFNYMQESPLIDSQNPFGDKFDTTYIYGPLHSREIFIGILFSIE